MPPQKVNLRLPFLFRTSFRRGKDFDYFVMTVPLSFYSTVEIKQNRVNLWADISFCLRNSVNSQICVCTKEMLPGKRTRFLGSHKNRLI